MASSNVNPSEPTSAAVVSPEGKMERERERERERETKRERDRDRGICEGSKINTEKRKRKSTKRKEEQKYDSKTKGMTGREREGTIETGQRQRKRNSLNV